jgi:peptidoglycan/xylan/chitin deacetylase (PgdA/CDA1 family)
VDRRGFLTAAGLVAAGAATAVVSVDAARPTPALSATARTASPGNQHRAEEVRVTFRGHPARPLVALTLDDGPNGTWTPRMLAMLAAHGIRATFYLVGARLRAGPELTRATAAQGHELGNHTWAHSDLTRNDEKFIADSLRRTHALIAKVTGQQVSTMRPPWGRIDSVGLTVCADLGYDVVLWSDHVTGSNAAADADTTLHGASAGSIVLAHDGGNEPNEMLLRAVDRVVGGLKDRGFRFVTVSELLSAPPANAPALPRQP